MSSFYDFVTKEALEEHLRIAFALVRFMDSTPYVPRRAGNGENAGKVGDLVLSEFWLGMYGKCQPSDVAGLFDMLEEGLGTDSATLKWEAFEAERLGRAFDQNRGIQEFRAKSEGAGSYHHGSYGLPEGSRFTKSLSPPTQSFDLAGDTSQGVKTNLKSEATGVLWKPSLPYIKDDYDQEREPIVKPEPNEDLWELTPSEYQALDEDVKPTIKHESTEEEWEATPFQYQDLSGNKIGPEPELSIATKSEWENSRMMVKEQSGRRLSQIPQYEGGEEDVMEGLLSLKDEEKVSKRKFEEDPERKLLDIPHEGQTNLKVEHGDGIPEFENQWHDRVRFRTSTRDQIRIRRFKWLLKLRSLGPWSFRQKTKARYRRRFLQAFRSGMLAKSSKLLRTTVISRSRKGSWRYVIGQRVKKRV